MVLVGAVGSKSRFAAYVEGLATVIGHKDRVGPLRDYCTGLMLPCERKSVEPMAAVLAPARTAAQHQSLHHLVADAPWNDEEMLAEVRRYVLPTMQKHGEVVAWIVDDTGFPKQGRHSVGVARQYCGQVGKQDNCQVAVRLSLAKWNASLPVAWRLYLPAEWAADRARRRKAGVPEQIEFATKPEIALEQLRWACAAGLPRGVVLLDAGYGNNSELRADITALDLTYVAGILSTTTVWLPGTAPRAAKAVVGPWTANNAAASRCQSTSRFRSKSLRLASPSAPGAGSNGARVQPSRSPRALRVCAFASPIAMISAPIRDRKSGC